MESNKTIRIFDGATAIITGGASGIGRALAEELAKRGCEVMVVDLQIALAQEVAAKIRASGGKAKAAKVDVTDFPAMRKLVKETVKRFGRLDYIFNNAGIVIGGGVNLYGIADWHKVIDVNLCGVINGIQAAYRIMLEQGFGHIVNTASMAGFMPGPGNTVYTMTKHGVVGLSTSLRGEAAQMGVRVSVVCPGVIRTPILEGGGRYGKMLVDMSPDQQQRMSEMFEKLKPMPPHIFARKVLNAVAKNKAIIIVPAWWRVFWWINRLSPALGIFLAQRSFQHNLKKLGLLPMQ
ncbi:MAG: short-chain dehydrogenase [Deltaproteobacteria bacterium RBG_16_54_11]|jgi:NAD(P)-dependent dehydrogenase (short-subunit alcohol dehydrogenase family)|nr:MAG: short-chain dehydrogenase [Deltaproteobacteria bacterium RBG_16_54_11]